MHSNSNCNPHKVDEKQAYCIIGHVVRILLKNKIPVNERTIMDIVASKLKEQLDLSEPDERAIIMALKMLRPSSGN